MEGIVLLMVTLAPWCYGAVDPIFEYGLFVGVGLLAALWGIRSVIDGKFVWFSCPVVLSLGFIFLIGVIQLVPVKAAAQYRGLLAGLSSTEVPADPERF